MVDVPMYHFSETDFAAFLPGDKIPVVRDQAGNRKGGMMQADALCGLASRNLQAAILQTNGSGRISWTFPTPFGVGVVPVISADVLATSNQPYAVRRVSLDNTQITLDILGASIVTILSINVLAAMIAVGTGIDVHIVARAPT